MHLDALDKLFPDAKEREDVMLLLLGSKNLKTGKFSTESRKWLWDDERVMECMLSENDIYSILPVKKRFYHVLKTNQAILLGGFYIVPLISRASGVAFISVDVSIEEQRNDGDADNAVSKLIHKECQIVPERMEKLYMQLKPNSIVIKPDCVYHIEFDLKLADRIYSYPDDSNDYYDTEDSINSEREHTGITDYSSDESDDLDDYASAHPISFYDQIESNQEIDLTENLTIQCHSKSSYGHKLIKGFKFIQL